MKTLDEVIKGMEHCHEDMCIECPYQFEPKDFDCITQCQYTDALHYLKEYRTLQCGYVKAMADLEDNPALSWDELKGMEGKPVWVEAESLSVGVSPYWNDWYIIKSFSNDEFMYCNDGFKWAKETQGRLWQAYRKERK